MLPPDLLRRPAESDAELIARRFAAHPAFLVELRDGSGWSDATVLTQEVYTEGDPEAIRKLLGWGKAEHAAALGPCLVFPYPDGSMCRLKPSRPRVNPKSGKTIKYESPLRSYPRVYHSRRLTATELIADRTTPVLITEGEKKAAKGDQDLRDGIPGGLIVLGLGGVDMFGVPKRFKAHRADGGRRLINDLLRMQWRGRVVFVCFDSDAAANPGVARAERYLAEALHRLGALVFLCRLPQGLPGPDGKPAKVGLDDYLLHNRARHFASEVLGRAQPFTPPAGKRTIRDDAGAAARDAAREKRDQDREAADQRRGRRLEDEFAAVYDEFAAAGGSGPDAPHPLTSANLAAHVAEANRRDRHQGRRCPHARRIVFKDDEAGLRVYWRACERWGCPACRAGLVRLWSRTAAFRLALAGIGGARSFFRIDLDAKQWPPFRRWLARRRANHYLWHSGEPNVGGVSVLTDVRPPASAAPAEELSEAEAVAWLCSRLECYAADRKPLSSSRAWKLLPRPESNKHLERVGQVPRDLRDEDISRIACEEGATVEEMPCGANGDFLGRPGFLQKLRLRLPWLWPESCRDRLAARLTDPYWEARNCDPWADAGRYGDADLEPERYATAGAGGEASWHDY